MPFVTKRPSHYFQALGEDTREPLHVGLYLAGSVDARRLADLVELGRRIRTSSRPVRCLWLRFKDGDGSLLDAFGALCAELAAPAGGNKSRVGSVVFEGRAGTDAVRRAAEFLARAGLRGLQLRRTDADATTFDALRPLLADSRTLRVLDVSSNPAVDDGCVRGILDALMEGGTRLETLNVGEGSVDGEGGEGDPGGVTGSGVAYIAKFVSKTPSLTSLTLRLRQLDDVGIGEISLVIRQRRCHLRRLDLSGNFGNSGVKIFAEALKTNTSVHTVSFGCHKAFDDVGARELLCVVDPFSRPSGSSEWEKSEWENVARSNHTLQSVYILDRPTVTASKEVITRLQSVSKLDPHRTLQSKCWRHIEKNIEDISHLGLGPRHMPEALAFVHRHGSLDHLFRLVRSHHTPALFACPSPERARMSRQMERIEAENASLRGMLAAERERSAGLHEENGRLRRRFGGPDARRCCPLPARKLLDAFWSFAERLREPATL